MPHARVARTCAITALVALGVLALHKVTQFGGAGVATFFNVGLDTALILGAAAACVVRGLTRREERHAWLLMGFGIMLWTAGSAAYDVIAGETGTVPIPSFADVLWLPAYPVMCVAFLLVVRNRLTADDRSLWLDAAIAAIALAAVAASVALPTIIGTTEGPFGVVATGLAYVMMDLVLLLLVTVVFGLSGWRPGRAWLVAGAGLLLLGTADLVWLFQTAQDTYVPGRALDALWPAAFVLVALAAWQPIERKPYVERSVLSAAVPTLAAMTAVLLLVWDHFERLSTLAAWLAAGTAGLAAIRLFLVFIENQRLLQASRAEALKDALTGLSNRRLLMRDIQDAIATATPEAPLGVLLLDLNGFKEYNDTFGHPEGDQLLVRLSSRFRTAVAPHGNVYRLGGDEFCALLPHGEPDISATVARAAAALAEDGEGFSIDSSWGLALVPGDAAGIEDALAVADRRMYRQKGSSRTSALSQSRDVLMRALSESEPALGAHVEEVASLAARVAHQLGMSQDESDQVARAAQLHDIGKVAIPDSILDKPGPLSHAEWVFMKRHTLIGERILAAAPALAQEARIVRSTHERFDGGGYPDGLAGDAIPLGARIVFVCDAYNAMISRRPYSEPLSTEDALAELRRCSGTQFDPRAVDALCNLLSSAADALPFRQVLPVSA